VDRRRPIRGLLSFLFRLPYCCWAMRRIIDQRNIRIINPHFPGLECLLFLAMKALRQYDGQIVLTFHGSDVANALSTTRLERFLWKMLLRHADHIVVVSNSLGSELLTMEPRVAEKVRTIYNGVDSAFFGPMEDETRPRLPALNHQRGILSVGSFTLNKGHDVLIRAFGHVLSKVPDARLVLVGGDGPEIELIRQLIDSMSFAQKVNIFKDVPHERIPAFLSQADLFVLASHREGHPLAVIEAGAVGVPIVCTRTTGSLELISDKVTGRLVEVGDEHALAEAMIYLLTHPEDAQRLATEFHEYVKNNLTWGHTYEKYIQLVSDCASRDVLVALPLSNRGKFPSSRSERHR
jgi:glycosyltransferase involved in cell wall biosynthesis